jgi:hypothetical protein
MEMYLNVTHTSLSAPSIQTNFAFLKGFARFIISAIIGPVKSAVETPAAPQENPLDFRTWFCSLRLFPAQTMVTGAVI